MVRHLLFVAIGFRLAGALLAIASIAAIVDLGDTVLLIRRTPPPDTGAPLDVATYGLVAFVVNAARAGGYLLHALAAVAGVLLVILIGLAVLALLFGVLLYLTGRGIGQHATWARIIGMMISFGFALVSFAVMMAIRRNLAPDQAALAAFAVPIGLSLYTLWVLIWRFA
jgi:hypothetical protein